MIIIKNANVVNENKIFQASVVIKDQKIYKIAEHELDVSKYPNYKVIDATGKYLFPGVIDDQVHFREPGLTEKADIYTESKAAVAGGVTSYMEMPNTIPPTVYHKLLEEKFSIAEQNSLANYSFYLGATNANISEILNIDNKNVCGIKIFMGSSTGNLLVDNIDILTDIFRNSTSLIATHCEDEQIIQHNTKFFRNMYGEDLPMKYHKDLRSEEACYKSTSLAVELAEKYNTRLHVLHISTEKELHLFNNNVPSSQKKITAEACVHHLWFDESDYQKLGTKIKWNPAIKREKDKNALVDAVNNNKIDVIATDHAPHLLQEKITSYFKAPSGGPLVQHSLQIMLELYKKNKLTLEKIVEKMCHTPADIFKIDKRGYIKKGYWADLVVVDMNKIWQVNKQNILYKCNWSPFENYKFSTKVTHTLVNGNLVFENDVFNESFRGKRLTFNY